MEANLTHFKWEAIWTHGNQRILFKWGSVRIVTPYFLIHFLLYLNFWNAHIFVTRARGLKAVVRTYMHVIYVEFEKPLATCIARPTSNLHVRFSRSAWMFIVTAKPLALLLFPLTSIGDIKMTCVALTWDVIGVPTPHKFQGKPLKLGKHGKPKRKGHRSLAAAGQRAADAGTRASPAHPCKCLHLQNTSICVAPTGC